MSWEGALRLRCADDAAVAAIVGTKIAWDVAAPGWVRPYLILQVIADNRDSHMKDWQSLRSSRVQIDCWSSLKSEAWALRDAVLAAITPAGVFDGVQFERITSADVRGGGAESETGFIHREMIDCSIWHD